MAVAAGAAASAAGSAAAGAVGSAAAGAAGSAAAGAAGSAAAGAAGSAAAGAAGSAASGAAGSAASGAASSAAGNVAGEAGQAAGKAAGETAQKAGQQTAQQTQKNLSEMKDKAEDIKDKVDQAKDLADSSKDDDDDSNQGGNGGAGGEGGEGGEGGPKPGDKAGTGKQIGEDGKVEDSSTAKSLKAAGRVAARVYGGEAGGQAADAIAKSQLGDKAIGMVSDVADKTPGVAQATKLLDKAGVADGVNDALDTYEKAKSGDIKGAMESAKKTKKDLKKTKKFTIIITVCSLLITFAPIILCLLVVAVIAQSMSNESTESTDKVYSNMSSYQWSESGGESGGGTEDPGSFSDTDPEVKVGEAAEVPSSSAARLKWLFPNGTPTSASQMTQYLTTIEFQIITPQGNTSTKKLTVHKKLASAFEAVFKELYEIKFPVDPSCTGAYNWRGMNGNPSKQSHHSYGSVVDFNYTYNPFTYTSPNPYLGKDARAVTPEVVTIFKKYGFKWGGDWKSKKDYMHFTYTGN